MFAQICAFFDNVLSKCKCEFRKGYSTTHKNLKMLEERKKCVGKRKVFGALLTDLSKTFDCLDHKWLTAKLNVYGFNIPALRLKHDYFSNRRQKNKNWKYLQHLNGNCICCFTPLSTETAIIQYLFGWSIPYHR